MEFFKGDSFLTILWLPHGGDLLMTVQLNIL